MYVFPRDKHVVSYTEWDSGQAFTQLWLTTSVFSRSVAKSELIMVNSPRLYLLS